MSTEGGGISATTALYLAHCIIDTYPSIATAVLAGSDAR